MGRTIAIAAILVGIVARALVPIIGVVLLGWSAPKLLVIYFADTAAAYYVVLASMVLASGGTPSVPDLARGERLREGMRRLLRAIVVPVPTLLVVGTCFGILPLLVMLDMQDAPWAQLLRDRAMWYGVAAQFALAFSVVFERAYRAPPAAGDPAVRVQTAGVIMRWLVMVLLGFFLARYIPRVVYAPLLIIAYAAMTAALDLAPARMLAWGYRVVGPPPTRERPTRR